MLDLRHNRLVSLPVQLGRCRKLEELKLDFNEGFEQLPHTLGRCTRLKYLSSSFTDLVALPRSIFFCTELSYIHLLDNKRLRWPPPDVIKQGNRGEEVVCVCVRVCVRVGEMVWGLGC